MTIHIYIIIALALSFLGLIVYIFFSTKKNLQLTEKLNKDIAYEKNKNNSLRHENSALQADKAALTSQLKNKYGEIYSENQRLFSENRTLYYQNTDLKDANFKLKKELNYLRSVEESTAVCSEHDNLQLREEIRSLKAENANLSSSYQELSQTLYSMHTENNRLSSELSSMSHIAHFQNCKALVSKELFQVRKNPSSFFKLNFSQYDVCDSIFNGKIAKAFSSNLTFVDPMEVSCKIQSGINIYETTLSSCSCKDFEIHKKPCKHMLYLQYFLGIIQLDRHILAKNFEDRITLLSEKSEQLQRESLECSKQRQKAEDSIKQLREFESLLSKEKSQKYPHVAALFKKYQEEIDHRNAARLSTRATTSREIIQQLKLSNKELKYRSALAEHQLIVYESMFPWLEEYKTLDIEQAIQYARSTVDDAEYDRVSKWLSPEEYQTLSVTDKNQLALDRYKERHKSDWEIGVEYERYIGYCYESLGFKVIYSGATERLEDMGRDLICEKDGNILIVQCKRWSEHKTIHEKHIFQLFGTVMQLKSEHPSQNYVPVFVTTSKLSNIAKLCADQLGIKVSEHKQYSDYPCIKCNVGATGEKIYHLPFDQQYDRVTIDPQKGEQYVATVKEAEQCGFRRAKRHFAPQ